MVAQGLTEKVTSDKTIHFYFPSCGSIPPPVIMVQVRHGNSGGPGKPLMQNRNGVLYVMIFLGCPLETAVNRSVWCEYCYKKFAMMSFMLQKSSVNVQNCVLCW
jgi:hypothetical protein